MSSPKLPINICPEERTALVEWLLSVIASQAATIEILEQKTQDLEAQVEQLSEALKKAKKLPGKPQLKASRLEQPVTGQKRRGKRAGSAKRSKKTIVKIDEERIIEPDSVPLGATFNGYRDYDVQELLIESHTIRFKLAEYVSAQGGTVVGQLAVEYDGHYGPTLKAFILYQHRRGSSEDYTFG